MLVMCVLGGVALVVLVNGRRDAELNRAAKLTSLGDRPLAVITAAKGYAAGWPGQQDDLATLSSNSAHRTVAGATRASLVDDKTDAA